MHHPRPSATTCAALLTLLAATACAPRPLAHTEPPRDRLQTTRAAELGGRWSNLTNYCVEPDGSTSTIGTAISSGDPSLDQIYRDTVAEWRFRPISSQSCDTVRFDEDFGVDRWPQKSSQPPVPTSKKIHLVPIATPPPSAGQIAFFARNAKVSNWTLVNRTSYCVGPDGQVGKVETLRSSGVPTVDAFLRATVATWQYEPVTVDGRPDCVSTDFTFDLKIH